MRVVGQRVTTTPSDQTMQHIWRAKSTRKMVLWYSKWNTEMVHLIKQMEVVQMILVLQVMVQRMALQMIPLITLQIVAAMASRLNSIL